MAYLDIDLEIEERNGEGYVVVARSATGETRRNRMRFPYTDAELERQLDKLQIALLRSGGERRRSLSDEEREVQNFGHALFVALFSEEVRGLYDASRLKAALEGKDGVRLRLNILAPELASLPWEYLYDRRQASYLCLSRQTPLVRYPEVAQPLIPLKITPPLRILGMIASPSNLDPLDVEREKEQMHAALKDLEAQHLVQLDWVPGQTWRHLQREMRVGGPWHIFHFIGHGGFEQGEGVLAVANDEGKADLLSATQLGMLLANHPSLRLVVLNSCDGARGDKRDLFSSTAATLMRRGLPAVLAMQYDITDRAALEYTRTFYESLADRLPVDAALAEARAAINLGIHNSLEWGTPVLYLHAQDGLLFDLTAQPIPRPTPPTPASEPAPVSQTPAPTPAAQPETPTQQPTATASKPPPEPVPAPTRAAASQTTPPQQAPAPTKAPTPETREINRSGPPNFFLLLGLDPAAPWNQAEFERVLMTKQLEWGRLAILPTPAGQQAKRNLELVNNIKIRMGNPQFREAEAKNALIERDAIKAERLRDFDQKLTISQAKGYVTKDEIDRWVREYKDTFSEAEITQRIFKIIKPRRVRPPQLEPTIARSIGSDLAILQEESLYTLLKKINPRLYEGSSVAELLQAARELYSHMQKQSYKDSVNTTKSRLAGQGMVVFKTEDMRQRYDETLRQQPLDDLRQPYEAVWLVTKEADPQQVLLYVNAAREKGWDVDEVVDLLIERGQRLKFNVILPSELLSSAKQPQRCGNCGTMNPDQGSFCRRCGQPLRPAP